jgi:hypothetical protein
MRLCAGSALSQNLESKPDCIAQPVWRLDSLLLYFLCSYVYLRTFSSVFDLAVIPSTRPTVTQYLYMLLLTVIGDIMRYFYPRIYSNMLPATVLQLSTTFKYRCHSQVVMFRYTNVISIIFIYLFI